MTSTRTCDNPMCACEGCRCTNCTCGAARLGELERRVMDILWQDPDRDRTGREVAGYFPDSAYTTVATVLDRLVHKGLVTRRMVGRSIRFVGRGTRGAHTAVVMREALAAGRDPDATLVHFAGTLSSSEAAILRRALGVSDGDGPRPADEPQGAGQR